MIGKVMSVLETIGAVLIVAAFAMWSGDYWKISNTIWWSGVACVTPVIVWKAWPRSFLHQVLIGIMFCALIIIGHWWFGKKEIKAKIPYLPEVSIRRN